MHVVDPAALAFLIPGLLFVAMGVPLVMRRVVPNPVYGLRTAKAFSSSSNWYNANAIAGFDFIVAGAMVSTTAVANAFAGLGVAFNVSVLLSSVLIAVAHSAWELRRL